MAWRVGGGGGGGQLLCDTEQPADFCSDYSWYRGSIFRPPYSDLLPLLLSPSYFLLCNS